MVKILTYSNNLLGDKPNIYTRKDPDSSNSADRILAEDELSELVAEGWTIISSSSHMLNNNVLGNTINGHSTLIVILQK